MNVTSNCYVCGQEVKEVNCPRCFSGHTIIGVIEFFWNGYLAKRAEAAWCKVCDFVWIIGMDGTYSPVCRECRRRHLELAAPAAPPAVAEIPAAAA